MMLIHVTVIIAYKDLFENKITFSLSAEVFCFTNFAIPVGALASKEWSCDKF